MQPVAGHGLARSGVPNPGYIPQSPARRRCPRSLMGPTEKLLLAIGAIFVLGTASQWLAWWLKLPSILLLLATGFLVGPVSGLLQPDALFGELLFPLVSLSVAVVLFEGSLSLRAREIRGVEGPLRRLLSIGVLVTWCVIATAAHWVLGIDLDVAILLGAMLTVTGPTVVGPLLRHVRPSGRVSSIARWEGIVVDPIGAVLAVLVFEAISHGTGNALAETLGAVASNLFLTTLAGGVVGWVVARLLALLLERHTIPDHLQSPVALMAVMIAFVGANLLRHEAGLIAVTLMGVLLANRPRLDLRPIYAFKENLTVLLVANLFILLSARVDLAHFTALGWRGPCFVAIVILLARPLSVFASTIGTALPRRERLFLAWLAPRGIVAAAIASVFALRLGERGEVLVSATFLVIVATVLTYGLTAFPLALRLGLASRSPQGSLILGADEFARGLANALKAFGHRIVLLDTNRDNVRKARMDGLDVQHDDGLAEAILENLDFGGLGHLLALTSNEQVNELAAHRFAEVFGRAGCYRLTSEETEEGTLRVGRELFAEDATARALRRRLLGGQVFKTTRVTEAFDAAAFRQRYGDTALLLATMSEAGRLRFRTRDGHDEPLTAGTQVLALVDRSPEPSTEGTGRSSDA